MTTRDRHGRPHRSLRVSVTDRCNLRCRYCMPEEHYTWLPRTDLLRFGEIARLVRVFTKQGVDKVRLTGGEPLLRRDLPELVARLAAIPAVRDLALTTNAVRLEEQAVALRDAGLDRLTVSLDTLRAERFAALTGRDELDRVRRGLEAADEAGFVGTKLDTVVLRGQNDDEIPAIVRFARERGYEARFIEYMDVGGANRWTTDQVVSREDILARIEAALGSFEPTQKVGWAPADRFRLADGTPFGVISSTTAPFCATCDRSRLTADGQWFLCLYASTGVDLREPLRDGASDEELAARIADAWTARADRGAEDRLALDQRGPLHDGTTLSDDPHLEMHTRGG